MKERTPLFLMANLGSEISKIYSAKEKNDTTMLDLAKKKAFLIVSEIKNMPNAGGNTEINILEDIITDLVDENKKYHISSQNLKSYFFPFIMRLTQA